MDGVRARPSDVSSVTRTAGPARLRWQVVLAVWAAIGVFFASREYLTAIVGARELNGLRPVVANLADAVIWAALTPLVLWIAWRVPLRQPRVRSIVLHIVAGTVIALVSLGLNAMVYRMLYPARTMTLVRYGALFVHFHIQWYWGIVAVGHGVAYYRRYHRHALRASNLEAQLATARLDALRAQLQPHLLFNSLNAIAELIHENPPAADRMVTRLGALLRRSIDGAGEHEITLREELDFLSAYLEIEQTRFGDRLTVAMDVDAAWLDIRVPALILQPLVENAVRHGVAGRAARARIAVRAMRRGDALELVVEDDGPGLPPAGAHAPRVGVGNTQARLAQLYGERGGLELRNGREGGVRAVVTVPLTR